MKKYTVILLYADYMTDNYGQDTWMDTVEAESVDEAITAARKRLLADQNRGEEPEAELENGPDDLFVIAVIDGEHQDIKSHSEQCV